MNNKFRVQIGIAKLNCFVECGTVWFVQLIIRI